mgnify:FL=1
MRKLLFFYASWCGPCKVYDREIITPMGDLISADRIERIDAWKEPHRAEKYHVKRLPTIVLLDGDTICMNRTGAIDIKKVAEWLKGGSIDGNVIN